MTDFEDFSKQLSIADHFRPALAKWFDHLLFKRRSDILVVVDTEVSTSVGTGFGIRRVIDLIRTTKVGCLSFRVDIAVRTSSAPTILPQPNSNGAKYTGFRFDMKDEDGATPLLNRYEQVWCFGFKPDNSGGPDSNITQANALPTSDAELAALCKWMDERKGGVFATGDHDYLGASMCHRIPRVRTMRRWTNADQVPPINTPDRIDTLRFGTEPLDNTQEQADAIPQPIQWVSWSTWNLNYFWRKFRPHPLLCHPTLGPIDVMPDHGHEGLCFDNNQVVLNGTYNFDGQGAKPEYPSTPTGTQLTPRVIAYGSTLGSPPAIFDKGPQPFRPRFPMISVYDGHAAGVGRVAVDSTWHHWMNVNLDNLAAAGGANWDKISRYFINLASWLNPPGFNSRCFILHATLAHFGYLGLQEFSPRLTTLEAGRVLRSHFKFWFGPCWITQIVRDILWEIDLPRFERIFDRDVWPHDPKAPWPPRPNPCLTCPPLEMIEDAVLGGIVRQHTRWISGLRAQLDGEQSLRQLSEDEAIKLAHAGALEGLSELGREWRAELKAGQESLGSLGK